jgi:hypothetical protein
MTMTSLDLTITVLLVVLEIVLSFLQGETAQQQWKMTLSHNRSVSKDIRKDIVQTAQNMNKSIVGSIDERSNSMEDSNRAKRIVACCHFMQLLLVMFSFLWLVWLHEVNRHMYTHLLFVFIYVYIYLCVFIYMCVCFI